MIGYLLRTNFSLLKNGDVGGHLCRIDNAQDAHYISLDQWLIFISC